MQQFPYVAEIFVIGGIASAAVIAADLRQCRQPMRIMNSVWILTGLWAGVFGLWAYYAFGRTRRCALDEKAAHTADGRTEMPGTEKGGMDSGGTGKMPGTEMPGMNSHTAAGMAGMEMHGATSCTAADLPKMEMPDTNSRSAAGMAGMEMYGAKSCTAADLPKMEMPDTNSRSTAGMAGMEMPARPRWQSVTLSTLHCGAGCTLADLVGEWFLFFVPVAIGGSLIAGAWVVDYILALVFGIGFQYAAIRGMEPETPRTQIVRRAAKADILSLTAWQAGMYGWMAVVIFVLNDGATLPRTSFGFWFMMQIAMACGFIAALPVNVLLIRKGIKKGM